MQVHLFITNPCQQKSQLRRIVSPLVGWRSRSEHVAETRSGEGRGVENAKAGGTNPVEETAVHVSGQQQLHFMPFQQFDQPATIWLGDVVVMPQPGFARFIEIGGQVQHHDQPTTRLGGQFPLNPFPLQNSFRQRGVHDLRVEHDDVKRAHIQGVPRRPQEIVELTEVAGDHRRILEEYSLPFLDQIISALTAATLVCYALYAMGVGDAKGAQMQWTIPFVLYGMLRYLYLVYHRGHGDNPTKLVWSDRPLQATAMLWLVASALGLYVLP